MDCISEFRGRPSATQTTGSLYPSRTFRAGASLPLRYRQTVRPDQRIRRSPVDAIPARVVIRLRLQQLGTLIPQRRPPRKHVSGRSEVRRAQKVRRLFPVDAACAGQVARVVEDAGRFVVDDPVVRALVADWERLFAGQGAEQVAAGAGTDFLQHLLVGYVVEGGDGWRARYDALRSVGLRGRGDYLDGVDAVGSELVVVVWLA